MASIIPVRYTLGTPLRRGGSIQTYGIEGNRVQSGTAERYINPITRYLKAVPWCTEADSQIFCQSSRVKALMMMISCSTLREGVSAGLGRDDVRTVTVAFREPCPKGAVTSDFPTLVAPLSDRR